MDKIGLGHVAAFEIAVVCPNCGRYLSRQYQTTISKIHAVFTCDCGTSWKVTGSVIDNIFTTVLTRHESDCDICQSKVTGPGC